MNFSEPLVTPEELQGLLGWPLPTQQAHASQPQPVSLPGAAQPPSKAA